MTYAHREERRKQKVEKEVLVQAQTFKIKQFVKVTTGVFIGSRDS